MPRRGPSALATSELNTQQPSSWTSPWWVRDATEAPWWRRNGAPSSPVNQRLPTQLTVQSNVPAGMQRIDATANPKGAHKATCAAADEQPKVNSSGMSSSTTGSSEQPRRKERRTSVLDVQAKIKARAARKREQEEHRLREAARLEAEEQRKLAREDAEARRLDQREYERAAFQDVLLQQCVAWACNRSNADAKEGEKDEWPARRAGYSARTAKQQGLKPSSKPVGARTVVQQQHPIQTVEQMVATMLTNR